MDANNLGQADGPDPMKKLIALIFLLSLAACTYEEESNEPPLVFAAPEPVEWRTITVSRGDMVNSVVLNAVYTPASQVSLSFEKAGFEIEAIHVTAGDTVYEGQLIASLLIPGLDEELASLRHEEARLQLYLQQLQTLHDHSLNQAELTEIPVDDSEYISRRLNLLDQMESVQIKLNYLNQQNEARHLRSPQAGIVSTTMTLVERQLSTLTTLVAVITDIEDSFFVITHLASSYMEPGDIFDMTVSHDGLQTEVQAEMIRRVDHRAYLRTPDPAQFSTGASGRLLFTFSEAQNVITIPSVHIRPSEQGPFVFILQNNVRRKRLIQTGLEAHGQTEITSGLEVGELIIV